MEVGYSIAVAGTVATLSLAFLAWRRPVTLESPAFARPLLGILAATTLVAWHAHIFMAMILIPPMMYLYASEGLPRKALNWWVLFPATLYFVSVFVPEALAKLNLPVDHIATAIYFVLGLAQFAVDLYLFGWSMQPGRETSTALSPAPGRSEFSA